MSTLLHLAERRHWAAVAADGDYERSTRGARLDEVGFVHGSTASQMSRVADAVYGEVPASDLVLLVVDEAVLTERGIEVRWENLDGGAELFPHLYGPLPAVAVVAALAVQVDASGRFTLPDLEGLDVRATPPV